MSLLAELTRGWTGLATAYSTVQLPMLAALARSRLRRYSMLASPILAFPLTVVASVGSSAVEPLLRDLGAAPDGWAQAAVSAAISAGIGYTTGILYGRNPQSGDRHRRGTVIHDATQRPAVAHRSLGRGKVAGRELTLAGVDVAYSDESKHFKFVGTTGTGKSTAISELLGGALRRGDRAVIADPDGGYLSRFYDHSRGDVILNPFDRRSPQWDVYGEIRNSYDVEQLARSLLPDQAGSDRSWREYARTFFGAVVRQTQRTGVRDVAELYRLLVMADSHELRHLVQGTPAQPFLQEDNSRMFDSIRSVTSSAVGALDHVGAQAAPGLSVRDWVDRGRGVLFIPYRAGQIAALRGVISGWMRLAIFQAMDREPADTPLWFVVDELDALGPIDGLKDALARVRKFGGRCVLGFQSIAQVTDTYGHGEAHTIIENCANTLIFRSSASEGGGTARFASALIGQREISSINRSTSRHASELIGSTTLSEHRHLEAAVLDSQIEQLPDLAGFLKLASNAAWLRVRLPAQTMSKGNRARPFEAIAAPSPIVAAAEPHPGPSRDRAPIPKQGPPRTSARSRVPRRSANVSSADVPRAIPGCER